MTEKEFDYRSIKILAFIVPVMFIVTGLKYGGIFLALILKGGSLELTIFMNSTGINLLFYGLECLFTISLYVTLFRIPDVSSRWNAACILLLISLIGEVFLRILEWQSSFLEDEAVNQVVIVTLGAIPELLRTIGVICFLEGVRKQYVKMGQSQENRNRWTGGYSLWLIGLGIMTVSVPVFSLILILGTESLIILLRWLGFAEALFYLFISVPMGLAIRRFCQEYYLYRYNHG